MPSPVARHEPTIRCSPPTDPTGFIYPSYRAAQTETQRDMPSLESPHQGVAYVSSSVGGSVSTLSFQDTTPRNYRNPPTRRGGGNRAVVIMSGPAVSYSRDARSSREHRGRLPPRAPMPSPRTAPQASWPLPSSAAPSPWRRLPRDGVHLRRVAGQEPQLATPLFASVR
jgi:hypothetical protein